MGLGAIVYEPATMASAGTLSSEVDLGRQWDKVYLMIPTMTSNTNILLQASELSSANAGVYRRVTHPSVNQVTVIVPNDFTILSSCTSRMVPVPNGFRYMKVETTATVDSGCVFKFICSDGA